MSAHLSKFLLDKSKVLIRHLVVNVRHEPGLVVIFPCHFSEDVQIGWQLGVVRLIGRFNSQNGYVIGIQVLECLDDEVLPIKREALTNLHDLVLLRVSHFAELNVLSSRDLALFYDFFAVDIVSHFVAVSVAVVFAKLAKNAAFYLYGLNERFLEGKNLKLAVRRHTDLKISVV